jgi:hypothetical protein
MGTTPVILTNATDTWVYQISPDKARGTADTKLYAGAVSGQVSQSLLYFGLPFPRGVTIISAKLRIVQDAAWSGTRNIRVSRIGSSWSATKTTYNNKPGTTGTIVSLSKSSPADLTIWEFDVTSILQTVSNGSTWYGLKIEANTVGQAAMRWHSPQASRAGYRPVLEVSWKDNPLKPTVLHPSDGHYMSLDKPTVSCDFTDLSGDTQLAAINVRLFSTEANAIANTSPEFDSGEVATSVPELDLSTTAYGGVPADADRWWRVRVKDGAGLWSAWSDYEKFTRKTKGTLTLNNPAAPPNNFVAEATPPLDWSFAGRTQRAYQLAIADSTSANKWLWTSGKITSSATVATVPAGVLTNNGKSYIAILRVWDTWDRESLPGDTPYVEITRTFSYQYDATVNPATGLTGAVDPKYPWLQLDWSRSTQPDEWNVYRDGDLIWSGVAADLFVSGTSYRLMDRNPQPRKDSVWSVVAVVNGKGASGSPTVSKKVVPKTALLSSVDGSNPVLIWSYAHDMTLTEVSNVFTPLGNGAPVLLTQSEGGYQGHITGALANNPVDAALSAGDWLARFNALKKNNGATLLLTLIDRSFRCFIQNANAKPLIDGEGVLYQVDFDFYQTDWVEP